MRSFNIFSGKSTNTNKYHAVIKISVEVLTRNGVSEFHFRTREKYLTNEPNLGVVVSKCEQMYLDYMAKLENKRFELLPPMNGMQSVRVDKINNVSLELYECVNGLEKKIDLKGYTSYIDGSSFGMGNSFGMGEKSLLSSSLDGSTGNISSAKTSL